MNKFIKPITELEPVELDILRASNIYRKVRNSWNYSEGSEAYYAEYFSDFKNDSFVCFENSAPVAMAFIYSGDTVGYFDQPTELFVSENGIGKKTTVEILTYLQDIARNKKLVIYAQEQLLYEMVKSEKVEVQYKNQLSYKIDLSLPTDQIKQRVRKRYKSMINWGYKNINYKTIDSVNFDDLEFDKLKAFHLEVAGRKTRSDESWNIQKEMIRSGEAFLLNGYMDEKLVSSNWFTVGETSYYGVGVYDRELMTANNRGLAHGSMFKAVEYLAEKKYRELLLALWYPGQQLTEKEEQIMDFKRGFTDRIDSRLVTEVLFKS